MQCLVSATTPLHKVEGPVPQARTKIPLIQFQHLPRKLNTDMANRVDFKEEIGRHLVHQVLDHLDHLGMGLLAQQAMVRSAPLEMVLLEVQVGDLSEVQVEGRSEPLAMAHLAGVDADVVLQGLHDRETTLLEKNGPMSAKRLGRLAKSLEK